MTGSAKELRLSNGTLRIEGPSPASGGTTRINLLTFEIDDGRAWCLGVFYALPQGFGPNQLRGWAGSLVSRARHCAAIEARERFLGETLAYVRSLPEGCRSDRLAPDADAVPDEDREEAVEDVRRALAEALRESDPYRAAVAFERATPYLQADVGLVSLMQSILPPFESAVSTEHYAAAAAAMERQAREPRGDGDFRGRQIAMWRRRSGKDSAVDGRPRDL